MGISLTTSFSTTSSNTTCFISSNGTNQCVTNTDQYKKAFSLDANFQAISLLLQNESMYHIQNFETTTLWTCKLNETFIQGDVKNALLSLSAEDPAISLTPFFSFFETYGLFLKKKS